MNRTRLGIQTTIVLVVLALVSWPEYRPVRALSVWHVPPEDVARADAEALASSGAGAYLRGTEPGRLPGALGLPRNFIAPPSVTALGATFNALVGRAQTARNTPIPYARLVLRDIATGQVIAHATADQQGVFQFLDVAASAYVVELLGRDGGVISASEMVAMRAGDVRESTIRVSASARAMALTFGNTLAATLTEARATAGRNDLTRTAGPGDVQAVSPAQ